MTKLFKALTVLIPFVVLILSSSAAVQTATAIPPEITTPNQMQSNISPLEFWDGVPSVATAEKVRDALAFNNALAVYTNSFRGASA